MACMSCAGISLPRLWFLYVRSAALNSRWALREGSVASSDCSAKAATISFQLARSFSIASILAAVSPSSGSAAAIFLSLSRAAFWSNSSSSSTRASSVSSLSSWSLSSIRASSVSITRQAASKRLLRMRPAQASSSHEMTWATFSRASSLVTASSRASRVSGLPASCSRLEMRD